MCDVLDKVESRGIEKGIRPLAVPPPRGFFCPPIPPVFI